LVKQKAGFEVGTRGYKFDAMNPVTEVEPLAMLRGSAEKPLQAPAEVGSLGYVRLGLGIGTAQQEDGWGAGDGSEYLGIAGGDEVEVSEHEAILVRKPFFPLIYADKRGSEEP
jgi:hypothetical protein